MAKALAHPLRVQLLSLLNEGVASPNELAKKLDEPLAGPNGPTDESDVLDDRLLFRAILCTLSPADQELAHLRYYEDLTCAMLAEHFGLSEATVKVRLHRLRAKLRQRLEDQT